MIKYIVTHSGGFHLDEILACAVLQNIFEGTEIIRTRDTELISKLISKENNTIVIDIYGIYDHKKRLYDHHQRGFNEIYDTNYRIKLSSSGLIYKHYGKEFLKKFIKDKEIKLDDDLIETYIKDIYEEYFLYADAIDNGITIESNIRVRSMADIIENFNIDETNDNDNLFFSALDFVKKDLNRYMESKINTFKKYSIVKKCIEEAQSEDILYVDGLKGAAKIVLAVEKNYGRDFKYVINQDLELFKIYAVSVSKDSFTSKCPLKEEWRGLRDSELAKSSGFEDAIFVHSTGFLGVAKSFDTAWKMCQQSLLKNH